MGEPEATGLGGHGGQCQAVRSQTGWGVGGLGDKATLARRLLVWAGGFQSCLQFGEAADPVLGLLGTGHLLVPPGELSFMTHLLPLTPPRPPPPAPRTPHLSPCSTRAIRGPPGSGPHSSSPSQGSPRHSLSSLDLFLLLSFSCPSSSPPWDGDSASAWPQPVYPSSPHLPAAALSCPQAHTAHQLMLSCLCFFKCLTSSFILVPGSRHGPHLRPRGGPLHPAGCPAEGV